MLRQARPLKRRCHNHRKWTQWCSSGRSDNSSARIKIA
jgi:hypothetical protein